MDGPGNWQIHVYVPGARSSATLRSYVWASWMKVPLLMMLDLPSSAPAFWLVHAGRPSSFTYSPAAVTHGCATAWRIFGGPSPSGNGNTNGIWSAAISCGGGPFESRASGGSLRYFAAAS